MSKSLLHSLIVHLYPVSPNSFLKGVSSPRKTPMLTFRTIFFLYFFVAGIAPSLAHTLLAITGQNCLARHKLHYRKTGHRVVSPQLQPWSRPPTCLPCITALASQPGFLWLPLPLPVILQKQREWSSKNVSQVMSVLRSKSSNGFTFTKSKSGTWLHFL